MNRRWPEGKGRTASGGHYHKGMLGREDSIVSAGVMLFGLLVWC